MASLQCQKPAAQPTVCHKTTNTATCHKANEHHLADKMKQMTTKMLHHDNHGQQSACHGAKTQHSAGHGSTAMHGGHANHGQHTASHGSTAVHGSHGSHNQQTVCHGSKKEGGIMHKIGSQLNNIRKKKNKDGHCRDGSDSSDSSSSSDDESDNENCGRKKKGSC